MNKRARRAILLWLILVVMTWVHFLAEEIPHPVSAVLAILILIVFLLYLTKIVFTLLLRD